MRDDHLTAAGGLDQLVGGQVAVEWIAHDIDNRLQIDEGTPVVRLQVLRIVGEEHSDLTSHAAHPSEATPSPARLGRDECRGCTQ